MRKISIVITVFLLSICVGNTVPNAYAAENVARKECVNILLIGTDERSESFADNARSDCMILLSVNRPQKTIKMVSFERGMGVPILSGKYQGEWDWLTHIFRYGGSSLLIRTIEECFDIEIDRYIRVNFRTVTNAVNAIGGIDLDLTEQEASVFELNGAGTYHLDGDAVLTFARLRQIDSDWARVARQRKVISAGIQKLKKLNFSQLQAIVKNVLPLVQTDLSKAEIAAYVLYAPTLLHAELSQMTIPQKGTYGIKTGLGNRNYFAADFKKNASILKEFLYEKKELP